MGDILVVVGSPCVILVLLQTFSHRLENLEPVSEPLKPLGKLPRGSSVPVLFSPSEHDLLLSSASIFKLCIPEL